MRRMLVVGTFNIGLNGLVIPWGGAAGAVGDVDGDGRPEIVAGGWDGRLYIVGNRGEVRGAFATGGPVFAAPTLADVGGDGRLKIIAGSWDERLYVIRPPFGRPGFAAACAAWRNSFTGVDVPRFSS